MTHQSPRRSIIRHPHDFAGAPQILSPSEGVGSGSSAGAATESSRDFMANAFATLDDNSAAGSVAGGLGNYDRAGGSGELDLIPQRSAPPPPGSSPGSRYGGAAAASSAGASASAFVRPGTSSSSSSPYAPKPQRSSYIAGSYRPGGPSGLTSAGAAPTRPGLPSTNTGLPSSYSSSSGSAGGPPRPVRSNTNDGNMYSFAAPAGSSSGFAPPSGARAHASVSGPAPSPHLTASSPLGSSSPNFDAAGAGSPNLEGDAYGSGGSQSHFVQGSRSRDGGAGGPGGRNTFKSAFGGFLNSMSGESSPRRGPRGLSRCACAQPER
jgi:p21-activated kinase 1